MRPDEQPKGSDTGIKMRTFLILKSMEVTRVPYSVAADAVASTAIEHPEWDLDEKRTWDEWEAL